VSRGISTHDLFIAFHHQELLVPSKQMQVDPVLDTGMLFILKGVCELIKKEGLLHTLGLVFRADSLL
jgi:hypothetical protein